MIESHQEELFAEPKSSLGPKLLAGLLALVVTALVFAGYTLIRKRHAETSGSLALSDPATTINTVQPPKALIILDEALLQGGKTIIGGAVKNTSPDRLEGLAVELQLKHRTGGAIETRLVPLAPAQLDAQQEGRYSLELKAQDYSSAKLVGLKAGPNSVALPYTTAQGQKRPPERLETKTIIVGKPSGKRSEFLNSPDNPARVP